MRIPTRMGTVELIQSVDRGGRWCGVWRIQSNRLALGWHVQEPRCTVLAVHVDQVPEAPCKRRERIGVNNRCPLVKRRAVLSFSDRPAAWCGFPAVLLFGEAVESPPGPIPYGVGQPLQLLRHLQHGAMLGPARFTTHSVVNGVRFPWQ